MRAFITIILSTLIVAGGIVAVWLIFRTEPVARQQSAVAESAMLVETTGVEHGTFRPTIRAMGSVQAAREITLASRVPGYVVQVSARFEPGALVSEGDVLVELDRADFEIAIDQRRSVVETARAELSIEQGLQEVARSDLELFGVTSVDSEWAGEPLPEEDRRLVLREPQRDAAQARLDAAEAALRQARLELERTRVRAPFDAQVLTREVNLGSQVTAGEPLGRLVGTESYWVVATVQASRLRWLELDGDEWAAGATPPSDEWEANARVRDRTTWPQGAYRDARLLRSIGSLEEGTRLARLLVEVPDPLARTDEHRGHETLLLGAFVEVELRARPIRDVIRIERELLRAGDTVWVMEDGQLSIRNVDIVLTDAAYAYIADGLDPDDRIVVTNLASVVEGAPLRVEGSGEQTHSDDAEAAHEPEGTGAADGSGEGP